jgi:hypothetical protein
MRKTPNLRDKFKKLLKPLAVGDSLTHAVNPVERQACYDAALALEIKVRVLNIPNKPFRWQVERIA